MHHRCPHHAGALVRHDFRGQVLWRCVRCEGVWVPGPVVARVAGEQPQWPQVAGKSATPLRCPGDGHPLYAVKARGIELDWCAHCHGVWLDQGELAVIAAQQAAQASPADDSELLSDLAQEGLDAGIDVAGDLIGRVGRRLPRPGRGATDTVEIVAAKPPPLPSIAPASLDARGQPFAVELDATSAVSDGAEIGTSLLDSTGEVAGQLIEGALSLIGDIFSGL